MKNEPSDSLEPWIRERQEAAPKPSADFAESVLQQLKPPRRDEGAAKFLVWGGKLALVAGIAVMGMVRTYSSLYLMCSNQL